MASNVLPYYKPMKSPFEGSPIMPHSTSSGSIQGSISPYNSLTSWHLQTPSPNVPRDDDKSADYAPIPTPLAPAGVSTPPDRRNAPIYFYDKGAPFYEFTSFSPHPVDYQGKRYPTCQHLFQSFKFIDNHPDIAERIRNCGQRPMLAFNEAHRNEKWVRPDWRQVNVGKMEIALRLKFTQHPDLKTMLLRTGEVELIEDSPRDYFWGIGANKTGRNELGKVLERLREELRREDEAGQDPKSPMSNTLVQQSTSNSFSSALNPGAASLGGAELCKYCQKKPVSQNTEYCGRDCANEAAKMCRFCRTKPRHGSYLYCSRTCAAKEGGQL